MWGQALNTGERGGKTAFIEAVQEITTERDVLKAQRDSLVIMLISAGVRQGIVERVLDETEEKVRNGTA